MVFYHANKGSYGYWARCGLPMPGRGSTFPAMRLAFYTYSYTDKMEMSVEAALKTIAQSGYDGIDISGTHGNSADPLSVAPELRRLTRDTAVRLGLRIEAIITHANLTDSLFTEEPLDLAGSVDLAVEVGAPLVVFHMGGPARDAANGDDVWRRVVDYLKESVDYAAAREVKLAVDGVWKDWLTETSESFLQLHDDIGSPHFGINFDPCYLMLLGLDPVNVAHLWGKRIVHAHLKDHEGTWPDFEHRIPGRGVVDYPSVVQALKDIGFDEAISIETFPIWPSMMQSPRATLRWQVIRCESCLRLGGGTALHWGRARRQSELPAARDSRGSASCNRHRRESVVGFHAPQEAARILTEAADYARQGQMAATESRVE